MLLDGFKIGSRNGNGVAIRKDLLDFSAHCFQAILKWRKRAKRLWDGFAASERQRPHTFEEARHGLRVVAGLVEILQTEKVSVEREISMEFEIGKGNGDI